MLIRFATISFAASLMAGVLATGCTVTTSSDDDGTNTSITIDNEESFPIDNIWISPTGWAQSDDVLEGVPLDPQTTITVALDCGTYDVEILDDTSTYCYISAYDVCGSNDTWVLTDAFFDDCAATQPDAAKLGAKQLLPTITKGRSAR